MTLPNMATQKAIENLINTLLPPIRHLNTEPLELISQTLILLQSDFASVEQLPLPSAIHTKEVGVKHLSMVAAKMALHRIPDKLTVLNTPHIRNNNNNNNSTTAGAYSVQQDVFEIAQEALVSTHFALTKMKEHRQHQSNPTQRQVGTRVAAASATTAVPFSLNGNDIGEQGGRRPRYSSTATKTTTATNGMEQQQQSFDPNFVHTELLGKQLVVAQSWSIVHSHLHHHHQNHTTSTEDGICWDAIVALSYSMDGSLIAVGTSGGNVYVYNSENVSMIVSSYEASVRVPIMSLVWVSMVSLAVLLKVGKLIVFDVRMGSGATLFIQQEFLSYSPSTFRMVAVGPWSETYPHCCRRILVPRDLLNFDAFTVAANGTLVTPAVMVVSPSAVPMPEPPYYGGIAEPLKFTSCPPHAGSDGTITCVTNSGFVVQLNALHGLKEQWKIVYKLPVESTAVTAVAVNEYPPNLIACGTNNGTLHILHPIDGVVTLFLEKRNVFEEERNGFADVVFVCGGRGVVCSSWESGMIVLVDVEARGVVRHRIAHHGTSFNTFACRTQRVVSTTAWAGGDVAPTVCVGNDSGTASVFRIL